MTDNKQYPPLPDFEEVAQHVYWVSRGYIQRGMLEPIHELMRAYVDADRAMRAQAAPAAVAEPLNELEELNLLNKLIELGARAANAHAKSNSDDGQAGTDAYVEWAELRADMGELIRMAYAAPAPAAQGAYAKNDRSRIDEIKLDLHPGPLKRELKVMRGMAACGGDDEAIQEAEIDLHRLQSIESAALLALGLLWMTERHSPKARAAFQTLRNALGGQNALRRGIEAAIDAGYEADHPPGADWWAGKKDES